MKNKIMVFLISSLIATLVFGISIYLLKDVIDYVGLMIFFVVYLVIFTITVKFIKKER